jgi:hypothetical protein
MQILVQNKLVETKEIANIVDIEADKKMFLNREAGFKIILLNGEVLLFSEEIPYESTRNEISYKKEKWQKLMDAVYEKWQSDNTEIETFSL